MFVSMQAVNMQRLLAAQQWSGYSMRGPEASDDVKPADGDVLLELWSSSR